MTRRDRRKNLKAVSKKPYIDEQHKRIGANTRWRVRLLEAMKRAGGGREDRTQDQEGEPHTRAAAEATTRVERV